MARIYLYSPDLREVWKSKSRRLILLNGNLEDGKVFVDGQGMECHSKNNHIVYETAPHKQIKVRKIGENQYHKYCNEIYGTDFQTLPEYLKDSYGNIYQKIDDSAFDMRYKAVNTGENKLLYLIGKIKGTDEYRVQNAFGDYLNGFTEHELKEINEETT